MIATAKAASPSPRLLGLGIYDVVDIARLVKRDPETIGRWTSGRKPIHSVPTKPRFTFLDVITLLVISELVERGVPKREIRSGMEYLADKLKTSYPFAHEALATVGGSVFGQVGDWVDVGKRGQMAFEGAIKEYLRPLQYGPDGLAAVWRPAPGISLNPKVQAGAPCIDGTRVATSVVRALAAAGDDPDDIAFDLEIDVSLVAAALEFEEAA